MDPFIGILCHYKTVPSWQPAMNRSDPDRYNYTGSVPPNNNPTNNSILEIYTFSTPPSPLVLSVGDKAVNAEARATLCVMKNLRMRDKTRYA